MRKITSKRLDKCIWEGSLSSEIFSIKWYHSFSIYEKVRLTQCDPQSTFCSTEHIIMELSEIAIRAIHLNKWLNINMLGELNFESSSGSNLKPISILEHYATDFQIIISWKRLGWNIWTNMCHKCRLKALSRLYVSYNNLLNKHLSLFVV